MLKGFHNFSNTSGAHREHIEGHRFSNKTMCRCSCRCLPDVFPDVFPMRAPGESPPKKKARQNENMGTPCNLAWIMGEKMYSNVFAAARAHRQRIRNESRDTTLLVQTMCSPCSCRCKRWTHRDSPFVSCKKQTLCESMLSCRQVAS